jgi:hypothetical protein
LCTPTEYENYTVSGFLSSNARGGLVMVDEP